MRLCLVISALERGGAERVLSVLANAWTEKGHDVTLITFDNSESPAYPLHPGVVLKSLGVPNKPAGNSVRAITRNLQRIFRLRRSIRESAPEIVLSFLDFSNIITLLATRRMAVPVIVSERANPAFDDLKSLWRTLRRRLYPRAAALVCQTNTIVSQIQKEIKVDAYAIPNPIQLAPSPDGDPTNPVHRSRTVVAMGRLVPQKGFDLLLDAFSRIADKHPDWSITILGKGPLKEQLHLQAQSLGLGNRVTLPGPTPDPFSILRAAGLFVFSSRFEGFGNALAEAMACGAPVVSFDCPAGPSDIIRNGIDGILVPPEDVAALSAAMDRLMSDPHERARMGRRAPEVMKRFSLESVLALWNDLFTRVRRASDQRVRAQNSSQGSV